MTGQPWSQIHGPTTGLRRPTAPLQAATRLRGGVSRSGIGSMELVESTWVGRQGAEETSAAPITSDVHRPLIDSAPDDNSDCEPFASPWSSPGVASLSEQRSGSTG